VRTRWNSTFDLCTFALSYRQAIDSFLIEPDQQHLQRKYFLNDEEWALITQLTVVLNVKQFLWIVDTLLITKLDSYSIALLSISQQQRGH
jgi:hypothetical protein